ncbi:fructose-1,6-bisphosphatase isozyme 2-like isoform X1 [Halyomorpha halys]|uniref:fructose-1,6-bisphosphatase isozyme 2-like isoform X1 n=1 Tax=Halyomorpha halys TaxID=286706 RepID=UPI0006D4DB5A
MEEVFYKQLLCPKGTILPKKPLRTNKWKHLTLTSFVSRLVDDFDSSRLIIAMSIAIKAISATLRKKASAGMTILDFRNNGQMPSEIEVSNEIFLQMIQDTGVVWQVGCATRPEIETFHEYIDAKFVVNFSAQEGLQDISCSTSTFAVYRKLEDPSVSNHTLQPGKNIIYSGYAVYGSGTVLYLSLKKNRVDGFLLDPAVSELVLINEDIKMPNSSPLYTINEAISFYYSQKILDWLEAKKNPSDHKKVKSRFTTSKVADVHRILKNGGIYCHPISKYMNVTHPHRLVYECQPLAHIVTQAGGLATDGKNWFLDITPPNLHCTTPFFVGSSYEIIFLLKFINPDLLLNEELPEQGAKDQ